MPLYLKLAAFPQFEESFELNLRYDIWTVDNSPLRSNSHIEDGITVNACTRLGSNSSVGEGSSVTVAPTPNISGGWQPPPTPRTDIPVDVESTPDVSPAPENPDDYVRTGWRGVYQAFIVNAIDERLELPLAEGAQWRGPISVPSSFWLADLDFDGIPELIVGGALAGATQYSIYTITDNGVELVYNDYLDVIGLYRNTDYGNYAFFLQKRLQYAAIVGDYDYQEFLYDAIFRHTHVSADTNSTIYRTDMQTVLDYAFYDTSAQAYLTIKEPMGEDGSVGTFNDVPVTAEEYLQLCNDLFRGYEEVMTDDYDEGMPPFLIKLRASGARYVTVAEITEFLDSYSMDW